MDFRAALSENPLQPFDSIEVAAESVSDTRSLPPGFRLGERPDGLPTRCRCTASSTKGAG